MSANVLLHWRHQLASVTRRNRISHKLQVLLCLKTCVSLQFHHHLLPPPLNLFHVGALFLAMPGCPLSVEEMKCVSGLFTLFHIFVTVMIWPHFSLETKVDPSEG